MSTMCFAYIIDPGVRLGLGGKKENLSLFELFFPPYLGIFPKRDFFYKIPPCKSLAPLRSEIYIYDFTFK